jgi:hypothetical protein
VGVWDHALTKTLERRFSAGSSGGAGAAMLHEVEIAEVRGGRLSWLPPSGACVST